MICAAEIVKEDASLTDEGDKCGRNSNCQVAAPIVSLSSHLSISQTGMIHHQQQQQPSHRQISNQIDCLYCFNQKKRSIESVD
jgi:hypothetical protein